MYMKMAGIFAEISFGVKLHMFFHIDISNNMKLLCMISKKNGSLAHVM